MRAGLVAVIVLALIGCEKDTRPPPFEPGVTIKLTRRKPQVNERVLQNTDTSLEAFLVMEGRNVPWRWRNQQETMFVVVDVDGFVVRRVNVTYEHLDESSEVDGKRDGNHDGRDGQTYVVWRDGGELMATYEAGGVPPDAERERVLDDNVGVGIDEPTEFTSMDMMLRSAKDGIAVFAQGMDVDRELHGNRQRVVLRGDVRIDIATGHWLEMNGTGSITGTYGGMPLNGSFKTKQSMRWTAPP